MTTDEADEISRLAELLASGNRCFSCGNCERCWAIWAPRPMTIEDHDREIFGRLKAKAHESGGTGRGE